MIRPTLFCSIIGICLAGTAAANGDRFALFEKTGVERDISFCVQSDGNYALFDGSSPRLPTQVISRDPIQIGFVHEGTTYVLIFDGDQPKQVTVKPSGGDYTSYPVRAWGARSC